MAISDQAVNDACAVMWPNGYTGQARTGMQAAIEAALKREQQDENLRRVQEEAANPNTDWIELADDPDAPDPRGLYRKFTVARLDGSSNPGQKHFGCEYFVLDRRHDKHAPAALAAYAKSCQLERPGLIADPAVRAAAEAAEES